MNNEFRIGNRIVGDNHPPFVIPEVGINHEGSYDKAIELVDAAIEAGAECIKFQCHIAEAEMVKTDIKPGNISKEPLWDIIKRCELTFEEEKSLQKYCKEKGIYYFSTPFSKEAADRLESMGAECYKIGSGECNNLPFIKHVALKGKPMIVSTGLNDIPSIAKTVKVIQDLKTPVMLMHCTSLYPTPYELVRLGALKQLKEEFNVPVGLSDHSEGIYTCLGAVALGACVLEKHFTMSKDWPGPDIKVSITPQELKEMIIGANAIFKARGGEKTILAEEKPVIDFAYASVCTIRPVKKGDVFSKDNIWVKRPGIGEILSDEFEDILGKTCAQDVDEGVLLKRQDVL